MALFSKSGQYVAAGLPTAPRLPRSAKQGQFNRFAIAPVAEELAVPGGHAAPSRTVSVRVALLVPGQENSSVFQTTAKQGVRANAVFPGGTLTPFDLRPAKLQDRLAKISNEGARKCAARPTGGCAGSRLSDSVARLRRNGLRNRFGTYGLWRPVHQVRQWPAHQR